MPLPLPEPSLNNFPWLVAAIGSLRNTGVTHSFEPDAGGDAIEPEPRMSLLSMATSSQYLLLHLGFFYHPGVPDANGHDRALPLTLTILTQ